MISVQKVILPQDLEAAFAIRRQVFVREQGCPPELEFEHDEIATHFLARLEGAPAGAARWRRTENGFKLERFAVLPEFRGQGVARALIKGVLADIPPGAQPVYLHAQTSAIPVYERSGFVVSGAEFEEAGILHYKMIHT